MNFREAARLVIDHSHGALLALEIHDAEGHIASSAFLAEHRNLTPHEARECPMKPRRDAAQRLED